MQQEFSTPKRKLAITEQTYYRWYKEYGGMRMEQAKRLKDLEKENARLKKLVADISLDNAIPDEYTRECLAILVGLKISSHDVID